MNNLLEKVDTNIGRDDVALVKCLAKEDQKEAVWKILNRKERQAIFRNWALFFSTLGILLHGASWIGNLFR